MPICQPPGRFFRRGPAALKGTIHICRGFSGPEDRAAAGGETLNRLLELYWTFVKIGCVTFGGGYAMLPILERELVDKRHWTTMDDLRDYFSIGQCTPGIIALNVSTFIGEKRHGVKGALAATVGFLTAPVVLILLIAMFLTNFAQLAVVQHAFAGIRVCVCVLIVQAVLRLWKKSVVDPLPWAVPGRVRAERLRPACCPLRSRRRCW